MEEKKEEADPVAMMRHGVVMFHNGRCGSSVLAGMLGKHPRVQWDGEVFNAPNALRTTLQGWQRWPRSQYYPAHPFRFLHGLAQAGRKEWYGFDVQFYQLPEIDRTLDVFVDRISRMGFTHFILLDRANYLRVLTSNLVAAKGSKYRLPAGEKPERLTIRINVGHVYPEGGTILEVFRKLDGTFRSLRPLLAGKPMLELNYENHILESPQVAYRMACEFIGVEPRNPPVELARTTPWPLSQVIENWDEVVAALRGTPWEWMAADDP
jgi:hypothetical protein